MKGNGGSVSGLETDRERDPVDAGGFVGPDWAGLDGEGVLEARGSRASCSAVDSASARSISAVSCAGFGGVRTGAASR